MAGEIEPSILPIELINFLFELNIVNAQTNLALIFFCFQFLSFLFNSLKTLFIAFLKSPFFPPHLAE